MGNLLSKFKKIFSKNSKEITIQPKEEIVYWTEKGKNYHTDKNCVSLIRSKNIKEGNKIDCPKDNPCLNCK